MTNYKLEDFTPGEIVIHKTDLEKKYVVISIDSKVGKVSVKDHTENYTFFFPLELVKSSDIIKPGRKFKVI